LRVRNDNAGFLRDLLKPDWCWLAKNPELIYREKKVSFWVEEGKRLLASIGAALFKLGLKDWCISAGS